VNARPRRAPTGRLSRLALAVAAVALVQLGGSASARALDLCGVAAAAAFALPEASDDDPLVRTARGVFERVYQPFFATTRYRTELSIVAPDHRVGGVALPPYAAICATGAAPRIYLTHSLLELLRQSRLYDESFLALVIAHELGHRLRDFDRAGAWIGGSWSREMEEHADLHGAYLSAAAGFGTRRLACDDVMDVFLQVEANVPDELRRGRKEALAEALKAFDVYESAYSAAVAVLFSDQDVAVDLAHWLNEHLETHAKPLGEFLLLEGLARMRAAIDQAVWQRTVWIPGASPKHLRCLPVYPTHTAFWDESVAGEMTALVARGESQLRRAESLIRRAGELGVDDLIVSSSLACSAFYRSSFDEAQGHLERARAAADGSPAPVRAALDANAALIAWGRWMRGQPAPAEDAPEAARRAWGRELSRAAPGFAAHPELAALLARLRAYPRVAPAARAPMARAHCPPERPRARRGPEILPPIPEVARAGHCPCGWTQLHTLTMSADDPGEGSLTTCVPVGWGAGLRWLRFEHPSGGLGRGLDLRLMMHEALRGPLEDLWAWDDRCDDLAHRGVGSSGERVFGGRCAGLGAPEVVLVTDEACRVTRAVVVGNRR